MLQGAVHKRAVSGGNWGDGTSDVLLTDGGIQDVRVRGRNLIENRLRDTEVLRENILGGMRQPIVNVEGSSIARLVNLRRRDTSSPKRTRLCQNRPHRIQGGIHSHPRDPAQYGQHPWGNTKYHHSSAVPQYISRSRRRPKLGCAPCIQMPTRPSDIMGQPTSHCGTITLLTTRCQWSSRIAPFFKCCWAPEIS